MTDEQAFDYWWKAYPRKVSKGDARKAWKQTQSIRPPLHEMLAKLSLQCKSEDWRKDEGKFICYPATYLRSEKWDDELEITIPGVVAGKDWSETWAGLVTKGKELGITESQFEFPYQFKQAVLDAAENPLPDNVFRLRA